MLREIAGDPLFLWVYRAVTQSRLLEDVIVATDSEDIMRVSRDRGCHARLTWAEHRNGTERVHEIAQSLSADVYLCVQGDEPLIRAEHIQSLLAVMNAEQVQVGTLKVIAQARDIHNPHAVKVVTDHAGRALYFSRAPIPFDRDGSNRISYYKHLGLYAYRKAALENFVRWPESTLEQSERLEQLRFLENGIDIHVAQTAYDTVGVDTEEDFKRVEAILASGKPGSVRS
jgi:3-deoxy-manno-octulosonate cytidylyltransferase (CMP-KDO synthetase)